MNNSIADRIVTTEDSIEINISEVFSDPDGDALTYTVRSSNPEVAEATIDGALVIITSMGLGDTTITITANDGKGGDRYYCVGIVNPGESYLYTSIDDT